MHIKRAEWSKTIEGQSRAGTRGRRPCSSKGSRFEEGVRDDGAVKEAQGRRTKGDGERETRCRPCTTAIGTRERTDRRGDALVKRLNTG